MLNLGARTRQLENEFRAAFRMIASAQMTAVLFHDTVTDGKPQPSSLSNGFGCEKGVKNTQKMFLRYSRTAITDTHVHPCAIAVDRYHDPLFRARWCAYGIEGVLQQVHQDLLQLP